MIAPHSIWKKFKELRIMYNFLKNKIIYDNKSKAYSS